MIKISYPDPDFRVRKENDRELIFDDLRKIWMRLTPEEWVRQNFVRYLVSINFPSSLIALEKKIMVGEMVKRFDILIFDRKHQPWMMIECKSSSVALSAEVLSQLLRYNIAVPVKYLVITNGSHCMVFKKENSSLVEMDTFPSWPEE